MSDLTGLRERIAEIDEALLTLIARRLALVQEVGAAKREANLPVRSYAAEREVLERYRALAARLGVDDHAAQRIAHELIAAAVRRQEEALPPRSSPSRRILLVGGAGKMGRWLARFFAGQGHDVATHDPAGGVEGCREAASLEQGVSGSDVVLVATPLRVGREVFAHVLEVSRQALVCDVFSLKSHVLDLLREAAASGRRVASLHPLFGPAVRTLSGRVMAVCDCGNSEAADEAAELFADTALTITRMPVERHDDVMQFVLGLSHLVAILFFTTLTASGRPFDELAGTASTTFWKEARTAAEVARENPELYYDIQNLNRHSAELFALVKASLATIEDASLAPRPEAFMALMERGRAYFPDTLPPELG